MRTRLRSGLPLAALCALASAVARAQPAPESAQRERPELAFAPEGPAPVEGQRQAQARTRARELTVQASGAYRAEDFAGALELFGRAYALVPAPELLFNLGQCQRHLRRDAQAQRSFRAYLRARPNAPERAQIERWIASSAPPRKAQPEPRRVRSSELAPSAARLPATAAPPASAEVVERSLVEQPAARNRARAAVRHEEPAQRDDEDSIVERWWFWTAIGVAVGGGITATLLLSQDDEPASAGSLGTVRWD